MGREVAALLGAFLAVEAILTRLVPEGTGGVLGILLWVVLYVMFFAGLFWLFGYVQERMER